MAEPIRVKDLLSLPEHPQGGDFAIKLAAYPRSEGHGGPLTR